MKRKTICIVIASVVLGLGLCGTIAYASTSDSSTEGIVIKTKCKKCDNGKIQIGENEWEDCGYCGGDGWIERN